MGAKQSVIIKLRKKINQEFPNLKITGFHNGYFTQERKIVDQIKATKPDMVFIALGYPKQEQFINRYRKCSNGLWIGLGGSFDVMSGTVKRAPKFWIKHNLEWLYRLIKEPQRLGRMMSLPKFVIRVYQQKKRS